MQNYCYECHGDGKTKGTFSLDGFKDLSAHLNDRKYWINVWCNLRSQVMPPSDKDQPNMAERKQLLAWIERDVFKLDPNNPDPGRVTIRRLNRTEYQTAVFDLLGVEYDKRKQDFYRTLAEKLLTYAIGRGIEYYDATTIDLLTARLTKNDGKLRELIQ